MKADPIEEEVSLASADQNPLVAAALSRVRRASENAARAPQPQVAAAQPVLSVDREATARALDPAIESVEPEVKTTQPSLEIEQIDLEVKTRPNPYAKPQTAHAVPRTEYLPAPAEPASTGSVPAAHPHTVVTVSAVDEADPLDYLTAEVQKIDRALEQELTRDDRASLLSHVITGFTDVLGIAAGSVPFMVLISVSNASFSDAETRLAAGVIVATVAFFYLSLTHCLCGKTFGMMLTNTHVVDAHTMKPLSARQAMLRVIGYFGAAAPAGLGLLWTLVDRRRRGWHDHLAQTIVTPDY